MIKLVGITACILALVWLSGFADHSPLVNATTQLACSFNKATQKQVD